MYFYNTAVYVDKLNDLLIPRQTPGPRVLDLFAGCGGLALGFEAQGFETIGYEMEEDYCNTYRNNLKRECHHTLLTPGTELPKVDVIIGGPPCQPFSVIGKQAGLADSRDGFPAFISAVAKVNPDIWMFENVRGLFYRNRWYLDQIIDKLRRLEYIVEARLLRTSDYGVPQHRERVVVFGHRGTFRFPEPLKTTYTAGDALGDLAFEVPTNPKWLTPEMDAYIAKYEKASKCIVPRDLHLDRPARTLTCRNLAAPTGDMMRIRMPDGRRRRLTVREAARLQTFPDWFTFSGNEESQYYQIGNAVPPLFAYYLAASIREYLESDRRHSRLALTASSQQIQFPRSSDYQLELITVEKAATTDRAYSQRVISATQYASIARSGALMNYIQLENSSKEFKIKTAKHQQLINEALHILDQLGIPLAKQTPRRLERMALAFLAVTGVTDPSGWKNAGDKFPGSMTTRDLIKFINDNFAERISDASYDDIRRKDLRLPMLAGLIIGSKEHANTNDGTRGYVLNPAYGDLVRSFGTAEWQNKLANYLTGTITLAEEFEGKRYLPATPVKLPDGTEISLQPGKHNELQKAIVEVFLPIYGYDPIVLYLGDANRKLLHIDREKLRDLNFPEISHEELPDIIAYSTREKWLYLIEAYHTSNPIDNVRLKILREKTASCTCQVIFVTAFLTRAKFRSKAGELAWETEVWIAEEPDHLIHFDGKKYLRPYAPGIVDS